MTCHITEDDKCQHGIPIESVDMHHCPHDGFTCAPCVHPACHDFLREKKRRPYLTPQHRSTCRLFTCAKSSGWTDLDGAQEWEKAHHKEVAK